MTDINEMSLKEIEEQQVIKELEYQDAISNLTIAEVRDNDLALQISLLQVERKKLAPAITQGKSNVRRVNSELRSLKTVYFMKREGL